ncbi:universal stress protein [Paraburkholderia dipogonis]|uniref:universal stress protein n=1 Tax=Paraburkholderia dipogonis TaxID=1211383 RepID=UPI0035E8A2CF
MAEQGVKGELVVSDASTIDDVSVVVLKAAADFNADLLVMGTHGRPRFSAPDSRQRRRALRVRAGASLPVLLIPSAAGKSR